MSSTSEQPANPPPSRAPAWHLVFKLRFLPIELLGMLLIVLVNGISLIPAILLGQVVWGYVQSPWLFALAVPFCYFVYLASYVFINAVVKILLCGRLECGDFELTEPGVFRWLRTMLFTCTSATFGLANIQFFRALCFLHYRLQGSRIAWQTSIGIHSRICEPELVSIGKGTILGMGALISGHIRQGPRFKVERVEIGARCIIGAYAVIGPGVVIEDDVIVGTRATVNPGARIGRGSILLNCSHLTTNTLVPPDEVWGGVPARKLKSRQDHPAGLPDKPKADEKECA